MSQGGQHNKRLDLQGLRAWAVIAVVLFHFFPPVLPFGYLGVDVFFVLSGFLITLVLSSSKCNDFNAYINFYFKRFRRIVPLLALVALILLFYIVSSQSGELIFYSTRSALYALLFATNLKPTDRGQDYFMALQSARDLFTHAWSLSVEMQFYVVAPLLLLAVRACMRRSFIPFLFAVSSLSLVFFASSSPITAFYCTTARLWQFLTGAIAYQLQKSKATSYSRLPEAKTNEETVVSPPLISREVKIACVMLCLIPIPFLYRNASFELIFRVLITIFSGYLVYAGLSTFLLTHKVLVFVGDISYSLYLVHWPIVCLLAEYHRESVVDKLAGIALSLALAAISYLKFEKWYLTLPERQTARLVSILYSLCLILLMVPLNGHLPRMINRLKNGNSEFAVEDTRNISLDEALRIGADFDARWADNLVLETCKMKKEGETNPWGLCQAPNGTGSLRFYLMGNSYTPNHGRMILKHLSDKYSSVHVHSFPSCEAILSTLEYGWCGNSHEQFKKDIEDLKPDVIFIMQRFIHAEVPIDGSSVAEDHLFKEIMADIEVYQKSVKKVFILQALPRISELPDKFKKKAASAPQSLVDGYLEEVMDGDPTPTRKRLLEVVKRCEKCALIDLYNRHLNENGQFMVYHPKTRIIFFETSKHHTPYGLQFVKPVYEKLAREFDSLMNSKYPDNILQWERN